MWRTTEQKREICEVHMEVLRGKQITKKIIFLVFIDIDAAYKTLNSIILAIPPIVEGGKAVEIDLLNQHYKLPMYDERKSTITGDCLRLISIVSKSLVTEFIGIPSNELSTEMRQLASNCSTIRIRQTDWVGEDPDLFCQIIQRKEKDQNHTEIWMDSRIVPREDCDPATVGGDNVALADISGYELNNPLDLSRLKEMAYRYLGPYGEKLFAIKPTVEDVLSAGEEIKDVLKLCTKEDLIDIITKVPKHFRVAQMSTAQTVQGDEEYTKLHTEDAGYQEPDPFEEEIDRAINPSLFETDEGTIYPPKQTLGEQYRKNRGGNNV